MFCLRKHVVSITPIEHTDFLYNFETTEHVYRVRSLGTLRYKEKGSTTCPKTPHMLSHEVEDRHWG